MTSNVLIAGISIDFISILSRRGVGVELGRTEWWWAKGGGGCVGFSTFA